MKNILFGFLMVSLFIFVSCGGDSEEDIVVDCDDSTLQISLVGTTNADCATGGSLEVSASGGDGEVEFSIDGGIAQSSGIFMVSAGIYSATATDKMGCTSSMDVTVNADANTVAISSVASTLSGCETTNATIDVTASGGTGTLMYQLDEGAFQTSNSFTNVGAGSHILTVKDGEECAAERTEQVLSGVSLVNDIMPILTTNCLTSTSGGGCHNGTNGSSRNWTIKTNIITKAVQIRSRTQSGSMPQAGSGRSLTQTEIDLIACWVDDGGLDN